MQPHHQQYQLVRLLISHQSQCSDSVFHQRLRWDSVHCGQQLRASLSAQQGVCVCVRQAAEVK